MFISQVVSSPAKWVRVSVPILMCGVLALCVNVQSGRAALLYDNGPWIDAAPTNTPTVGTAPGYSVRLPSGAGDYGWPVTWLPNNTFDSAADDFTINSSFQLNRIRLYAYESGATNTANTLTGAYLRIWNTAPTGNRLGANDARIVAGFVGTGATESDKLLPMAQVAADPLGGGPGLSTWTGVYRRQSLTDTTSSRPVIALDFDLTGNANYPALAGGTYWLEVSMLGSTTGTEAWVPTSVLNGSRAREITAGVYGDAGGAGTGAVDALGRTNIRPSIDFAFELYGNAVPEPTCLALLGVGALLISRRRCDRSIAC